MKRPLFKNYGRLILSILICQAAGWIGAIFTSSSVKLWYPYLAKPFFNPPSWVFGPVWTLLFLLMGVSLYIVWQNGSRSKYYGPAMFVFFAQLVFNIFWSVLFFGLKSPLAAFFEIIMLWSLIWAMIIVFRRISRTASNLQIPYLLWVSFAAVLNFCIYYLNR
ncbi:MAG: TspO/MBR family protein [Candidatus Woesearchaeota archaeon]